MASVKGNLLQPVTRHIIRVIIRGEAFVRDGKVHEAGIAGHYVMENSRRKPPVW